MIDRFLVFCGMVDAVCGLCWLCCVWYASGFPSCFNTAHKLGRYRLSQLLARGNSTSKSLTLTLSQKKEKQKRIKEKVGCRYFRISTIDARDLDAQCFNAKNRLQERFLMYS